MPKIALIQMTSSAKVAENLQQIEGMLIQARERTSRF